ncbi:MULTISPECIES: polysaccharide deacetylase family protein [unclassified Ruegeria]|uniref:polysaccharide deacetylase family protein n=1 Tax=unclassified Ruegeria TaxID=2625375 RepID=UPI001AE1B5B0|nr:MULTISPECIES: polysaccharide deacetylase family protein [unclassified Ruegeria]
MTHKTGLNFHGIGEPGRSLDPGEAPFWVSPEQFEQVLSHVVKAPANFEITFDDGNLSDHDIALPALQSLGLRARFFMLTGRIGNPGSLDKTHLRTLSETGMTIGSHGIDHTAWPTLSDADLKHELRASRARLEDICGHAITEAGIPFGLYDARVLRALKAAGYTTIWSSDGGSFRCKSFLRPRTSLRGDMSNEEIRLVLSNRMPPLRRLRRAVRMAQKRWTTTG